MEYIGIENYKKTNIILVLVFVLAVMWFLISLLFVFKGNPFQNIFIAHASDNSIFTTSKGSKLKVGLRTQALIHRIEGMGFSPVLASINKSNNFSVEGKIVTLSKDSISIFEYPDNTTISSEISSFQKSANTTSGSWKKRVHLYSSENIIVFYMGNKNDIINSLNSILGQAVVL